MKATILMISTVLAMPVFAAEQESAAMMQMHEHMQEMQKTMGTIAAEPDAAKRADLMAQHMKQMQESMDMMQKKPGSTAMQGMSMEKRMGMMEQHMDMMQMMMGQMMKHDQQEAEAPAHQHEH